MIFGDKIICMHVRNQDVEVSIEHVRTAWQVKCALMNGRMSRFATDATFFVGPVRSRSQL